MTDSLFDRIKADQLQARKDRATTKAILLGTVIGEASKNDKAPSDEATMSTLRKFIGGIRESLAAGPSIDIVAAYNEELDILQVYVPDVLSPEATLGAVEALDLPISLKNMKAIRAKLEEIFPGAIDGKTLADVVKSLSS